MPSLEELIHQAQAVRGIPPGRASFPFSSIGAVLQEHMRSRPDQLFLIYYNEANERYQYTYAEFAQSVLKNACLLQAWGIRPGMRIATAAHNHPDTIVQYFAAWTTGASVVPLNMAEEDSRLRYILENSGVRLLFCREEYLERLSNFCPGGVDVVPVYADRSRPDGFHRLLQHYEPAEIPRENFLEREALIVYTSGTTGLPKGVVLVQRNLFADGYDIARWHRIDETTRMMCVLPVHHVNGTIVTHVTPFLVGASVVLNRKFQTEFFFPRIVSEGVHIVSVVPTLLAFLLEADADPLGAPWRGFRHVICGAGPLTSELAQRFEQRYRIPIIHGYGLSETTCYSCFLPVEQNWEEHTHWMQDYGFPSIGIPIPCNEMAVHDASGNALPEGERGEIVIRGWNVMRGYFANPKANEEAFTHGWFRSGDEGFYRTDSQGRLYFFITGRLKELIIRGGVNISPLEIDEVLARAPGVRAGIAVGFEHELYGEEVGALIIPEEGASPEAIRRFCACYLPFYKVPKVVLFADSLPVTTTGKYQRNRVRHLFEPWKRVQFRPEEILGERASP
ncbi:MAG: acyl--CoA ligase [Candidatus Kapabacteria bacterium]|nr:acyl--CoA ligase [Candidatus Kapabacteria bacterium]MCS7170020.1 acyl--CoA ligase [Candidatus Kapabacteria bacterium]MDW7996559.1 class I adenylate-forming enzyme family protein [Bacteroidota bacterium]MDW8225700.1 class I adenylate-forming enzyme family protein [Bacteroidota bacterium]